MKKIFTLSACVIFLSLVVSMASGQGPDMKEGLWEVTVKMNMPGIPMKLPPQVHTQCMTREDLIPQKGNVKNCSGCKVLKTEIKGNTIYWLEECSASDGTVRAEGHITYSGDSFTGKVKITQKQMTMWQDLSGKWVGECK